MKSKILYTILICIGIFQACKKDYIVGGSVTDVNMYENMTTYEFLSSNALFDTLVQIIDSAGIKDQINADGTTFFAPTDAAILTYLEDRTLLVQNTIDQYSTWQMDSLFYYLRNDVGGIKDSLLMYLIPHYLTYDSLSSVGTVYPTALSGDSAIVSYEYTTSTTLGYNSIVSSVPQVIYFTHLWSHYDVTSETTAADVPDSVGVRVLVQTSGIATKNGIVNVLAYGHTLFYYGDKD
ncbi:MAG: fasciclin domain-containing protein [Chitinophagaceae bacterium]